MKSRTAHAWLASALLLAVLAGCDEREPVPPSEATAPVATARATLTSEEVAEACQGLSGDLAAPGWRAGALVVQGGSTGSVQFAASAGEPAVLVIQNGDGKGSDEAQGATVTLNGTAAGSLAAGARMAVQRVQLATQNQLNVSVNGGGRVRVSVAPANSLPCALVDLGLTRAGGTAPTVTRTFSPPDANALGVLVVDLLGQGANAEVIYNGVSVLENETGSGKRAFARVVELRESNTIEVRALGKPGSSVRAVVFDADTLPPLLAVAQPQSDTVYASSPIPVSGTVGPDARSVSADGQVATLSGDGFQASVPLVEGTNSVTTIAKDFCGNAARVCRAVVLDTHAPVITLTGVTDGEVTRGPVAPTWQAQDEHLASSSATLNGAPFQSGTEVSAEGEYTLVLTASDRGGLVTTRIVHFSLLLTSPTITLVGVSDGQFSATPLTPTFSATSPHLQEVSATLDGAPFTSGTEVSGEGEHVLVVKALDQAGNSAEMTVHFRLDFTPPVVELGGVPEGAFRNEPSAVTFAASDLHLASVGATLDGQPYSSGDLVSAEGAHTVVVTATDRAGNRTTVRRTFTLDFTPPVVSVEGVVADQIGQEPVTPTFSATDAHLEQVSATLDDAPFTSGTTVSAEGAYVLIVTATDLAGNVSRTLLQFTIDRTAPVITVSGVQPDERRNTPATVDFAATDIHLASVTATLDGAAFSSGTTVSAEGAHVLVVTATDDAGNTASTTVRFVLDLTPPVITVTGVVDDQHSRTALQPGFSATDALLDEVSATLDAAPFTSGTKVSGEGSHTLVVTAKDAAGNSASETVHFTIDTTEPVIEVTGVASGDFRNAAVTPGFTATDAHLASVSATLDGTAFTSGSTVSAEGAHTLVVKAEDRAGNTASVTVSFVVDTTKPVIQVTGISEGLLTNAPVTPAFTITDANPGESGATLDGVALASGTEVSAHGEHTYVVTAKDKAGNPATATVHFELDRVGPEVTVTGVADGERRNTPATITYSATDGHLLEVSATLGGGPFPSGYVVFASGDYELVVTATDTAGNTTTVKRTFTIDTIAPEVALQAPAEGLVTSSSLVEVVASVQEAGPLASVKVGGEDMVRGADGLWRRTVALVEGTNQLTVTALDAAGNGASVTRTVVRDSTAPELVVTAPVDGARVVGLSVHVQGKVSDATPVRLTINGTQTTLGADGTFDVTQALVSGENTLRVVATDAADNAEERVLLIRAVQEPPTVTLTQPTDGLVTEASSLTIQGTAKAADPADTVTVLVQGVLVGVGSDGSFSRTVSLVMGTQTLTVVAFDSYGMRTEKSVSVTRSAPGTDGGSSSPTGDGGTPSSSDAGSPPPVDAGSGSSTSPDAGVGTPDPAPVLFVEAPLDGAVEGAAGVLVTGYVEGGALPLSVKVNGVSASVSVRTFSARLQLAEGAHSVAVQVTDALGRTASTERGVTVDGTAPSLEVTRPATSVATVNETPYTVRGTVGDVNLASLSVQGQPALVVAGQFAVPVPLVQGQNSVEVLATDLAGNVSRKVLTLTVDSAPPSVTILEPVNGSEAPTPVVRVRARVSAFAQLTEVRIGTGVASQDASGDFVADVPLALGENTLRVSATDINGMSGSAEVVVRYRDPETEPLMVTDVNPAVGTQDVRPDALISVAFNKAVDAESVREEFEVLHRGTRLPGGYSIAPGSQIVSFVPRDALPEGETIEVHVAGVEAQVGPGQSDTFASQFTVRRPLTRVRGYVMDEEFQPLPGVLVTLEDTNESVRTGPDGNWALISAARGPTVVRFEGGVTPNGQPLPTVRRRLQVTPEGETVDSPLVLTPVDMRASSRVDASSELYADFGGRHGALLLEGPQQSFVFEDGRTQGALTATRIEAVALPVPLDGQVSPTAMWQVGPAGTRALQPVNIQFPNLTGLEPGRHALVLAHDPVQHTITRAGVARVTPDGAALRTMEPLSIRSLEFMGYMALTDEQEKAVASLLPSGEGAPAGGLEGTDGGMQGALDPLLLPAPKPMWKRLLEPFLINEAHAQSFYGYLFPVVGALEQLIANSIPGLVQGTVRAPQDRQLFIDVSPELIDLVQSPPTVTFPYRLPVKFRAQQVTVGLAANDPIDMWIEAKNESGASISSQGEPWSQSVNGNGELAGNVELVRGGTTVINLMARMGAEVRSLTLRVVAVPAADGGVDVYRLAIGVDSPESTGYFNLQSVVRFRGVRVTVTGPGSGSAAITGATGGYGVPVVVPAGWSYGISCADIPLGPRPIIGRDPETGAATVVSTTMASYSNCSPMYTINAGGSVRADVLVDARLLHGGLLFVDKDGKPLERECTPGAPSALDPDTGAYTAISDKDLTTTEVHFFRADNLERPIATYTVGAPYSDCTQSTDGRKTPQGFYARVRSGPTAPFKRYIRERCRQLNPAITSDPAAPTPTNLSSEDHAFYEQECRDNRTNFLRLSAGEPLVVFAVNHATGHAGMTQVTVPPISQSIRNEDGSCPLGEQYDQPFVVTEFGQPTLIDPCSVQELGIRAPVVLYPPEIDMRVWREAPDDGVLADRTPTLIRHGGAGTTRDTYVHLDTHWRVRMFRESTESGSRDAGESDYDWRVRLTKELQFSDGGVGAPEFVDGGYPPCRDPATDGGMLADGGREICKPNMLQDDGVSGELLQTCTEYGMAAGTHPTKYAACLKSERLTDVPAGVPPLAGRLIQTTGSVLEGANVATFSVMPGRGSAALQAGMRVVTPTGERVTLNLPVAKYYTHVVGHAVFPRDIDRDGTISESEKNTPPPHWEEGANSTKEGMPGEALALKNVYSSLDPDGFRVLRFDRDREHEFRVLDIGTPEVTAKGSINSRVLGAPDSSADPDDLAFEFLTHLIAPEEGRAGTMSGDYVVRFGGDAYGVDCELHLDEQTNALTGTCDNEFIENVLSANDMLYVELYLSGNAQNVLYRMNLLGISKRVDMVTAGSLFTAARSVETGSDGHPVKDRPPSIPAFARFALDPEVIQDGHISICTSRGCKNDGGKVLKAAGVRHLGLDYQVEVDDPGEAEDDLRQEKTVGINGSRYFLLPVPAHMAPTEGSGAPAVDLFLVQDILLPEPRQLVQQLGRPYGVYEGFNADPPGQTTVQNVNVADGHLAFEHEDFSVPQMGEVVRFARTYNNQNNMVSPMGVGWTHNHEAYVQEEQPGRYVAIVNGQGYAFPDCKMDAEKKFTAKPCGSDNSHGQTFELKSDNGDAYGVMTTPTGGVYEFHTAARGFSKEGQRRWLLDRYHDGHGRTDSSGARSGWTELTYYPDSNRVKTIERKPGHLRLEFDYEEIDPLDETKAYKLRNLVRNEGFALLDKVHLKRDGTELFMVDYDHDWLGNLTSAHRTSILSGIQRWEYTYVPLPEGLTGRKLWRAANEMEAARLKLNAPSGGTPVTQWEAVYTHEANASAYPHVQPEEIITAITGTGMEEGTQYEIVASGPKARRVFRPDGVELKLDLNDYGNTKGGTLAGQPGATAEWGSDRRGGPVQLDATVTRSGLRLGNQHSGKLQMDGTLLEAMPTHPSVVKSNLPGSPAAGMQLWKAHRDPENGRVDAMSLATGAGLATISRPLDGKGDPRGAKVTDPERGDLASVEQNANEDGVIQRVVDEAGNETLFDGWDQQPLGLPRFAHVSRPGYEGTSLGQYTVEYDYDALGRRTLEKNLTTGAKVESEYDSVGRILSRTISGDPPKTWTYAYELGEHTLTTSETLDLARGRVQTRKTVQRRGLKREDSYLYGRSDTRAYIYYTSYLGDRLVSFTDVRGTEHVLHHDEQGRLTGETVNGKSLFSYKIDDEGRVYEKTDLDGLTTKIRYDALGRAVQWEYQSPLTDQTCPGCPKDVESVVLDPMGEVISRTFGTLSTRHVISSTRDALGRERTTVSSSESVGGIDRAMTYDASGRVLSRTDNQTGLVESFQYDDVLGRLTLYVRTVESVEGPRTLTDRRVYRDSPDGFTELEVTRTFTEPLRGGGPRPDEVRKYRMDPLGRILRLEEYVDGRTAPSVSSWQYDAEDRQTLYIDPLQRETQKVYDAAGNLLELHEPGGVVTLYTPNAVGGVEAQVGPLAGEAWTATYDDFNRLEERKLLAGVGYPAATWGFTYAQGGVSTETEPEGAVITRTRNARGLVEIESVRASDTDAAGGEKVTRYFYDGPWLKKSEVIEGESKLVVARTEPSAIDDTGRTLREVESWTAPSRSYQYETQTNWDHRHAVVTESWAMAGEDLDGRVVDVDTDSLGNVVRRTQARAYDRWDYGADGKLLWSLPKGFDAAAATIYSYETSGRLKTRTLGADEITTYSYHPDGQLHTELEPSGRVRTLLYNARGLVESESYGSGADVSHTHFVEYDGAGNATRVRVGSDQRKEWAYAFAPRGELLQAVQPSNLGVFQYEYDRNARLKKVVPPAGVLPTTEYAYDFLGRERERKRASPTQTSTWTTSWVNGSPTVTNQLGEKVERLLDGRGRVVREVFSPRAPENSTAPVYKDLETAEYVFNGLDQMRFAYEQRTVSGQTRRTTNAFTYDTLDRLEVVDRDGEQVRYGYFASGARKFVTSPAGTVGYDVDTLQRLRQVTLADSSVLDVAWEAGGDRLASLGNAFSRQSYCYDSRGRVRSVTHDSVAENCAAPMASPRLRYTYAYDDSDNRVSEVVRRAGSTVDEVTSYGYDQADRLTGVRYPDNQSVLYKLAADGTRVGERHVLGYSGALDQSGFESSGSAQLLKDLTYDHDSLGGLRQIRDAKAGNQAVAQFTTDLVGRMTSETRADLSRTLHFDAAGRLVEAQVTEGTQQRHVKYQYDFAGLRRSSDADGFVTNYVWGGEAELLEEQIPGAGSLLYQRAAGVVVAVGRERMLGDVFGSPVARMSPSGEVARTDFSAYGEYRGGVKPTATMASLGFTGHSFDANLGLTYAQQRWYSPELGRFLSEDPVFGDPTRPMSLNPWLYGNGSPTRYIDRDGRFGLLGGFIGAAIGGVIGCAVGSWTGAEGGCAAGALAGAASGFIAGFTGGASLIGNALAGGMGMAINMSLEAGYKGASGREMFYAGMTGMAIGMAAGAAGHIVGGWLGQFAGKLVNSPALAGVTREVGEALIDNAVSQNLMVATGAMDRADVSYSAPLPFVAASLGVRAVSPMITKAVKGAFSEGPGGVPRLPHEEVSPVTGGRRTGPAEVSLDGPSPQQRSIIEVTEGDAPRCSNGKCTGGKGGCFVAGTLVETLSGKKPIEQVQTGDYVLSKSGADEDPVWRRVESTVVFLDKVIGHVEVESQDGTRERISATPDHPFWVDGMGWTPAEDLEPGDRLISSSGGWLRVTGSVWAQERANVYNFSVEGTHTYFVGSTGTWVHNSDCPQRGVDWVNENAHASERALDYQSGAKGAVEGKAPALYYDNKGKGRNFVKFDGFDASTKELIDRKLSFRRNNKAQRQLRRMSKALDDNPGFSAIIEVPTAAEMRGGYRLLQRLNIQNIKIRVVPE